MIKIDLHKRFVAGDTAFKLHFETSLQHTKLTALYGASGVGKTSVLRMLAGLLTPDQGHLQVNDAAVSKKLV